MSYYHYPKILSRFPSLIQLVYGFNWINQQRKWIVYRAINQQLKKLPEGSIVADIGCGEGQYLIPFAQKYPKLTFWAIDNMQQNVNFINTYASKLKLHNVHTICSNIETFTWPQQPHFAWCVGVLQYIQDDESAISKMAHSDKLLMYQPVHNIIETNLYKWVLANFSSYDEVQDRKRIYTATQLTSMLAKYFSIHTATQHYGKIGRITHEWRTSLQNIIFHGRLLSKVVAILLLVVSYPLIMIAMLLDVSKSVEVGNGLLVIATRKKK